MISLGKKLIQSLDGREFDLKRVAGGTYVDGVWQEVDDPENPTPTKVIGSVQPLSGREIMRIPEGQRHQQRKKFYTYDVLQPGDQANGKIADEITIDGDIFQVESVEKWNGHFVSMLVWKGYTEPEVEV